jgi:serine/threonine protein phosphatase 1
MNLDRLVTPWRKLPAGGAVEAHVFAIGDVHGHADLLEALLDGIDRQRRPAGRDRAIVFTGDLIDRGPENLRAIRLAMEAEGRCDRRIILPGNHEQMMLEAILDPSENQNMIFWHAVGGDAVIDEIVPPRKGNVADIARMVGEALPEGFVDMMLAAPSHHVEGPALFVHAGIPPWGDRRAFLAQGIFDHPADNLHWAWIREEFLDWTMGWDAGDDPKGRTVVVHGHTIEVGRQVEDDLELSRAMDRVTDQRRINLDIGSFAFGQLGAVEMLEERYRFHAVQHRRLA